MAEPLALRSSSLSDTADFSAWVTAEHSRVFWLCWRFLRDREEADAAVQDIFLKAYKALKSQDITLDDPGKWLTRIAVNTCLDRLRSRRWQFWKRRPPPEDEELILTMTASMEPTAEDRMFARQIENRLYEALESLSARQRAVFTLKHFENKSLEEISEILNLDVGTVKAHMARAVAKLRTELADLYACVRKRKIPDPGGGT